MSAETWDHVWTSAPMIAAGDQVAAWAACTLRDQGVRGDGLYVATPDAGAREAVAFWAAAQHTGLAFAAPAAFPWTLVNSATGRISLELGITGPCTTMVGGDDAVEEARGMAEEDLTDGRVERAVIVRLTGLGVSDGLVRSDQPTRFELSVSVVAARSPAATRGA